jgi:hypothetical protein
MPVLILACGRSNTGKTTTIRQCILELGVRLDERPLDTRIVLSCYQNRGEIRQVTIGLASGGDTEGAIRRNVVFFEKQMPEYVVMACRTRGGPWVAAQEFADRHGMDMQVIEFHGPTKGDWAPYIQERVSEILQRLP